MKKRKKTIELERHCIDIDTFKTEVDFLTFELIACYQPYNNFVSDRAGKECIYLIYIRTQFDNKLKIRI